MGRRSETRAEPRRGFFLALEALAGTAALLLDDAGALECGNGQACAMLDCADEAALRARWPDIAPLFGFSHDRPADVSPRVYHAFVPVSGGQRRFSLELRALDVDAGSGYFALLKDPAVLDPLERELMLASERRGWVQLREALLHDMKGILNSMQISLELICDVDPDAGNLDPEQERKLRRIASLKDGLMRMDRALRLLPGGEGNADPPPTDFDANELVREVMASLRHVLRRNNVELRLDLSDTPLSVTARQPWLRQALFNITLHCLNGMRAGGSLIVQAALCDRGVVVRLQDDVPDAAGSMLHESDRTFSARRGNGAFNGLQVARSLIEAHGGTIEFNASAGGTEILMRLPS